MMSHVYILETESDKYYIGSTTNLSERIKHHQRGFTPSTKRLKQPRLIFSQEYRNLREARSIEMKLKKLKRKDYIEKIIKEGVIKMLP